MGNNTHGNRNEQKFVQALNGKTISNLSNLNLKTFISDIYPNIDEKSNIKCKSQKLKGKQNIEIEVEGKKVRVSIAQGNGNSIHQEKLESFLSELSLNFNLNTSVANDIRFYIWGDGTINGKGNKESRLSSKEIYKEFPQIIRNIQEYFNNNKIDLVNRFLITGVSNTSVDFFYHGTIENGYWCKSQSLIEYIYNYKNHSDVSINLGPLTFQAWNRCIKGSKKELYRDTIQIKWPTMLSDIKALYSIKNINMSDTHLGSQEEYLLVSKLNKNKSNKNWEIILQNVDGSYDKSNLYAVKVSSMVHSKLVNKLTYPKSDIYIISSTEIDNNFLLERNFIISEDDIKNLNYIKVEKTGISIKKQDSNSFTFQKLNPTSFAKLFGNNIDAAIASIYVNEIEVNKNKDVLNGWKVTLNDVEKYFNDGLDYNLIEREAEDLKKRVEFCKYIKTRSIKNIMKRIEDDDSISTAIFSGKGIFDEPYCATFFYKGDKIEFIKKSNFSVTTGSGRSKGKYSIEVKPK